MFRDGFSDATLNLVAEPNFHHARAPTMQSSAIGSHVPMAPRLLSHLPTSRPMIFSTSANTTKNVALPCAAFHLVPPTYNALLAAKYSTAGKYGRLLVQ